MYTSLLQTALNHYIALDPEALDKCRQLAGKAISIELTKEPHATPSTTAMQLIRFQMIFTPEQIVLKANHDEPSDAIISGTPLSLLHVTLAKHDRKRFFAKDVSISGDIDLGQDVIALLDAIDIDWEEYLSHWIGDVPAHQLATIFSKLARTAKKMGESLCQSTEEFIHEEIKLTPPAEELEDFFCDIDQLRMDTDRLEERYKILEAVIQTKNEA